MCNHFFALELTLNYIFGGKKILKLPGNLKISRFKKSLFGDGGVLKPGVDESRIDFVPRLRKFSGKRRRGKSNYAGKLHIYIYNLRTSNLHRAAGAPAIRSWQLCAGRRSPWRAARRRPAKVSTRAVSRCLAGQGANGLLTRLKARRT